MEDGPLFSLIYSYLDRVRDKVICLYMHLQGYSKTKAIILYLYQASTSIMN